MDHWDRTYQCAELAIDGYNCRASVFTALDHQGRHAFGKLRLQVDSENGMACAAVSLTPLQMRQLARLLTDHSLRLEHLANEIATIAHPEAA